MLALNLFDTSVSLAETTSALFLSDLHIGDGSRADLFARQDDRLISFLTRWRDEADAIVLLGDILDIPQAWTVRRIRAAHQELWRFLSRLAQETRVVFVRGNHDWTLSYAELFPGATCCEAVLLGERRLAWHGHQVDLVLSPDASHATIKTYAHVFLERLVGRRLLPPLDRYDSPANRVALAIATLSARARLTRARALRLLGRTEQAAAIEARVRYLARSVLGDPGDIFGATDRRVLGERFDAVVCGHTHIPGIVQTPRGIYVNTGSWTGAAPTFAHWNGERFRVLEVDGGRELGGEELAGLEVETEPEDLFRWWARHHRGFLRFEF
jgi:UDP-2,3-diacylglucosamine pyrophosphatase LpxH